MPPAWIAALVRGLAGRTPAETAVLVEQLMLRSWPGEADGTHPVAREWLRRWSPAPGPAFTPDCACAAGRCGWCN